MVRETHQSDVRLETMQISYRICGVIGTISPIAKLGFMPNRTTATKALSRCATEVPILPSSLLGLCVGRLLEVFGIDTCLGCGAQVIVGPLGPYTVAN